MKTKPRVRDSSGYPAAQRGVGADSPAEGVLAETVRGSSEPRGTPKKWERGWGVRAVWWLTIRRCSRRLRLGLRAWIVR